MNYITITPFISASITLYGYMFDKTTNVFLSAANNLNDNISSPLTAVNHFSMSRRVSAICPPFTGHEIKSYSILNPNTLVVYIPAISGTGFMDIIWYNRAGYTKLSDENYLIRFSLVQAQTGVNLITIAGEQLTTINNFTLTAIKYATVFVPYNNF